MIVGNHNNVFEYDGAYKCLDCKTDWGALPNKPKDAPELCKGNAESEIIYRVVFRDLPCKCSEKIAGGCVFCAVKARIRAGEPPTEVLEDYL